MRTLFPLIQALMLCGTLVFSMPSCMPRLAPEAGIFEPARIASGVNSAPGTAAWSPDGKKLAFITDGGLRILVATGAQKEVPLADASFVAWTEQNEVMILRSGAAPCLSLINRESAEIRTYPLEEKAAAVYERDPDTIIVVYIPITRRSFGTEVACRLETLDRSTGGRKNFYTFNKTYISKTMEASLLRAWVHAGLNPFDRSLFVMELLRPPVFDSFSSVKSVDSVGERIFEIPLPEKKLYYSASWSPAGDRIALTDQSGKIDILDLYRKTAPVRTSPVGFYPSWNPRGGLLFAGGRLINSAGEPGPLLMKPDPWSIAWWSPDGSRLAIATEGNLWVLRNFDPRSGPRDRIPSEAMKGKMSLLTILFRDGFLTVEEYQRRKEKLLERMEIAP